MPPGRDNAPPPTPPPSTSPRKLPVVCVFVYDVCVCVSDLYPWILRVCVCVCNLTFEESTRGLTALCAKQTDPLRAPFCSMLLLPFSVWPDALYTVCAPI